MAIVHTETAADVAAPLARNGPSSEDKMAKLIALVDEWMKDETGYDEMAWPILAKALNENRLSARDRVVE